MLMWLGRHWGCRGQSNHPLWEVVRNHTWPWWVYLMGRPCWVPTKHEARCWVLCIQLFPFVSIVTGHCYLFLDLMDHVCSCHRVPVALQIRKQILTKHQWWFNAANGIQISLLFSALFAFLLEPTIKTAVIFKVWKLGLNFIYYSYPLKEFLITN